MVRMTVEEVYRGEKYGVMSAATADYLMNGRAAEHEPQGELPGQCGDREFLRAAQK